MVFGFVSSPNLTWIKYVNYQRSLRQLQQNRQYQSVVKHRVRLSAESPSQAPPQFEVPNVTPPSESFLDQLLVTVHEAVDAAGVILDRYFRQPIPVDYKEDTSPVTQADRLTEAAVREVIRAAFPDHVIIGEESGDAIDSVQSHYVWVIDPIDGTRAFICGRPTFTTLIAVLLNGFPIIGVISQPTSKQRWVGVIGRQTTLNGKPVAVRPRAQLASCILQATTPDMFVGLDGVLFRRVSRRARNVVYGGDSYAYALLASGCGDIVVEADLKAWDFLALVPVVEGAGGIMTDWGGSTLALESDGRVIAASSPTVFEEIITQLAIAEEEHWLVPHAVQVSESLAIPGPVLPEDPGLGHVESMTGFGITALEKNGYSVRVQVRSVNARYCEVQIRGIGSLSSYELDLINVVKTLAKRGRITVNVDIALADNGKRQKVGLSVDWGAVNEVKTLLDGIGTATGASQASVSDVLRFSEVLVKQDSGIIANDVFPIVKEAIVKATEDMCVSRRREGAVLEEDVMKRTRKIAHVLEDLSKRAQGRVEAERSRLSKILDSVVDRDISAPRLETEVTIFADRVDFSEEITRLQSHVMVFEMTFLGSDEPIGQRLIFLLQEMHREANTVGAKAFDSAISHLAVLMKEEIEKIREQCNNIR